MRLFSEEVASDHENGGESSGRKGQSLRNSNREGKKEEDIVKRQPSLKAGNRVWAGQGISLASLL